MEKTAEPLNTFELVHLSNETLLGNRANPMMVPRSEELDGCIGNGQT